MKNMKTSINATMENTVNAFVNNKIFYLSLKGLVVDGENATSTTKSAHLARISFAEVFYHEDNFTHYLAKPLIELYGDNYTRDVLCTEDWNTIEGDISRTFITLTWRSDGGELLAMVQVTASHMRECDCKFIPNSIVK
jgi:hypothetical protein